MGDDPKINQVFGRAEGVAYTQQGQGNQSRNGFLYNCYTHPLGRFFQNTIKGGILAIIRRIHDKEIPKYDKNGAYTYGDVRLQFLDRVTKQAIDRVIQDADKDRKRELLKNCTDICLFTLKEDVFYRPRVLQAIVEISEEVVKNKDLLLTMTEYEQYNLARFGGLDGKQHAHDFSDLSPEERAKLPESWQNGSVCAR